MSASALYIRFSTWLQKTRQIATHFIPQALNNEEMVIDHPYLVWPTFTFGRTLLCHHVTNFDTISIVKNWHNHITIAYLYHIYVKRQFMGVYASYSPHAVGLLNFDSDRSKATQIGYTKPVFAWINTFFSRIYAKRARN